VHTAFGPQCSLIGVRALIGVLQAGSDDGCGGTCVACTEPPTPPCANKPFTQVVLPGCSGTRAPGGRWCTCAEVEREFPGACHDYRTDHAGKSIKEDCPMTCNICPIPHTCPTPDPPSPPPYPPMPPLRPPPPICHDTVPAQLKGNCSSNKYYCGSIGTWFGNDVRASCPATCGICPPPSPPMAPPIASAPGSPATSISPNPAPMTLPSTSSPGVKTPKRTVGPMPSTPPAGGQSPPSSPPASGQSPPSTPPAGGQSPPLTPPAAPHSPPDVEDASKEDGGLSGGAIAGIVIGVIAVGVGAFAAYWFLCGPLTKTTEDDDSK